MMRISFIDHDDSFSANLVDWLTNEPNFECHMDVINWRDIKPQDFLQQHGRDPLVVSPGPKSPNDYPHTMEVLRSLLGKVPIFGVCLGHQMLGAIAGFNLKHDPTAWHGHIRTIRKISSEKLFAAIPDRLSAMSYNSLVLSSEAKDFSPQHNWHVWLTDEHDLIQGLWYGSQTTPAISVQFHPESFLSEQCAPIRTLWTNAVLQYRK